MALHKLTGGFAVGAVIRASAPSRAGAVITAAIVEGTTLLGAWLFFAIQSGAEDRWTEWLLAGTAGSLLYLGVHALSRSFGSGARARTYTAAFAGLLAMWVISLFAR